MATTVRKGVFETNSSSSHSISIEKIETNDEILVEGVLDIDKLWEFSFERDYGYSTTTILICDTFTKKLALAFCLINEESINYEILVDTFNIKTVLNHEKHFIGDEDDQFDEVFKAIENDNLKITYFYEYN